MHKTNKSIYKNSLVFILFFLKVFNQFQWTSAIELFFPLSDTILSNTNTTEKISLRLNVLYSQITRAVIANWNKYDLFCPPAETLVPCICTSGKKPIIQCKGVQVNQQVIENTMETLRNFNGLRPDQLLSLQNMTIQDTWMTQLDLSPFNLTRLDSLVISSNIYLIEVIGPESNLTLISNKRKRNQVKKQSQGKIDVKTLDLSSNFLTDEGLQNTFQYFNPTRLEKLNLAFNGIHGSLIKPHENNDEAQGEFLPGLSKLRNLRYLNMSWNAIDTISNGPFRMNRKLNVLALENNRIDKIGANAFLFEESSAELTDEDYEQGRRVLSIYLNFNQLSNSKISAESGLEVLEKTTKVYLEGNQFQFISSRVFQEFLNKDGTSIVDLKRNPLSCDQRVRWIRRQKAGVRRRVKNADCVNDPDETIFTTTLV